MEYVVYFLLGFLMARNSGSPVESVSSLDLQPLMDVLAVALPFALLIPVVIFGICTFIKLFRRH